MPKLPSIDNPADTGQGLAQLEVGQGTFAKLRFQQACIACLGTPPTADPTFPGLHQSSPTVQGTASGAATGAARWHDRDANSWVGL